MCNKELKPWQRREGESLKAFGAFQMYLEMDVQRSLDAVAQKCSKSIGLINRWSGAHQWVERVRAWEDHQAELRRSSEENAITAEAVEWREREREMREWQWQEYLEQKKRAAELLSYPITEEQRIEPDPNDPNQMVTIIIRSVNFTISDGIRLLKLANEMGERALNKPMTRTQVDINNQVQIIDTPRKAKFLVDKFRRELMTQLEMSMEEANEALQFGMPNEWALASQLEM